MDIFTFLPARIQVLLTSWVTWMAVGAVALDEIASRIDDVPAVPDSYVQWLVRVGGILTLIVATVRTHQKSDPGSVGLLTEPKIPELVGQVLVMPNGDTYDVQRRNRQDKPYDEGSVQVHILLGIIAVVCGVLIILVGIGAITMNGTAPWTIAGIGITAAGLTALV